MNRSYKPHYKSSFQSWPSFENEYFYILRKVDFSSANLETTSNTLDYAVFLSTGSNFWYIQVETLVFTTKQSEITLVYDFLSHL